MIDPSSFSYQSLSSAVASHTSSFKFFHRKQRYSSSDPLFLTRSPRRKRTNSANSGKKKKGIHMIPQVKKDFSTHFSLLSPILYHPHSLSLTLSPLLHLQPLLKQLLLLLQDVQLFWFVSFFKRIPLMAVSYVTSSFQVSLKGVFKRVSARGFRKFPDNRSLRGVALRRLMSQKKKDPDLDLDQQINSQTPQSTSQER